MKAGNSGLGPIRLLLALSLFLGAALAWLWLDETGQWRNLRWAAPKPLAPELKVPTDWGPLAQQQSNPAAYASILERPLFSPDRKPPPPPAPPAPPDPLGNIQIQGIFTGANAGILARVDGKIRRVKVNETVGPWTLKSVNGREVTFTQGDETRQLQLAYAKLGATPPPAQATPIAATPTANPAAYAGAMNAVQKAQDETRERLERRNALRASRGLPPVTD